MPKIAPCGTPEIARTCSLPLASCSLWRLVRVGERDLAVDVYISRETDDVLTSLTLTMLSFQLQLRARKLQSQAVELLLRLGLQLRVCLLALCSSLCLSLSSSLRLALVAVLQRVSYPFCVSLA